MFGLNAIRRIVKSDAVNPTAASFSIQDFVSRTLVDKPQMDISLAARIVLAVDASHNRQNRLELLGLAQAAMFNTLDANAAVEAQLIYYRGFSECRASTWLRDPERMAELFAKISALAGPSQISRVLRHVVKETRERSVDLVVLVSDEVDENFEDLARCAQELAAARVPVVVLHEVSTQRSLQALSEIARLTHGATLSFDHAKAGQMTALLKAATIYAAGGREALSGIKDQQPAADLLLRALPR